MSENAYQKQHHGSGPITQNQAMPDTSPLYQAAAIMPEQMPKQMHAQMPPQQKQNESLIDDLIKNPAHTHTQAQAQAQAQPSAIQHIRPIPRISIQCFCESDQVAATLNQATQDRRMGKTHMKVQMGGITAAVEFYQTATTPNLILVESRQVGDSLIHELANLADVCDEGTHVIVIGHKNDVQLYRTLISHGVSEYLVAPLTIIDFMDVLANLFVNPEAAPLGTVMAFIGAKGGVGSSTIAHNVAWSISHNFKSDVVLADLDLAFGTANIDFDRDPAQGVAEAVFSADRIDEVFLDRLLAKCSDHLSLLAAPSTLDRDYDFEPDDFATLIEVAQQGTPNVIVDLPSGWTGWIRETLVNADQIVITATPDLASLRNTKNLIDKLTELRPNDPPPFLVLNQCGVPKRPEISVSDFTQPLNISPSITLPFDPALFGLAANNGHMIAETNNKSDIAASLDTLAHIVTGRRVIEEGQTSSLTGLLSRLKLK